MTDPESDQHNTLNYASIIPVLPGASRLARFAIACALTPFVAIAIVMVVGLFLKDETSLGETTILAFVFSMVGIAVLAAVSSVLFGLIALIRKTHRQDRWLGSLAVGLGIITSLLLFASLIAPSPTRRMPSNSATIVSPTVTPQK